MTKYRTIKEGVTIYLQYESTSTVKSFWSKPKIKSTWHYIPIPYLNSGGERDSMLEFNYLLCSLNRGHAESTFKDFVKQYPDINTYLRIFEQEQQELVDKYQARHRELYKDDGKITYLN